MASVSRPSCWQNTCQAHRGENRFLRHVHALQKPPRCGLDERGAVQGCHFASGSSRRVAGRELALLPAQQLVVSLLNRESNLRPAILVLNSFATALSPLPS